MTTGELIQRVSETRLIHNNIPNSFVLVAGTHTTWLHRVVDDAHVMDPLRAPTMHATPCADASFGRKDR